MAKGEQQPPKKRGAQKPEKPASGKESGLLSEKQLREVAGGFSDEQKNKSAPNFP